MLEMTAMQQAGPVMGAQQEGPAAGAAGGQRLWWARTTGRRSTRTSSPGPRLLTWSTPRELRVGKGALPGCGAGCGAAA